MIDAPGDPFKDAGILPPDIVVRRDPDGTIRAHSPHPLGPYPERLTEKLDFWAALAPERCFLAERDTEGAWTRLTYGEARTRVRRIAQAFIQRGLSTDRTLLILSGNSIEHALLALAAMYTGVPYAPAAPGVFPAGQRPQHTRQARRDDATGTDLRRRRRRLRAGAA